MIYILLKIIGSMFRMQLLFFLHSEEFLHNKLGSCCTSRLILPFGNKNLNVWTSVIIQVWNFCFQISDRFLQFSLPFAENSVSGAFRFFPLFFSTKYIFFKTPVQFIQWECFAYQADWDVALNFLGGRKHYPTFCPLFIPLVLSVFSFQYCQYPRHPGSWY